ncbi:MAG: hypothetical protein ACO3MV_08470 [Flavobacteriales bacterium]
MSRLSLIWILAWCLFTTNSGIVNSAMAQDWDDWDDEESSYEPSRKGVEFAINFGVYQANHQASSAFYNGYAGDIYDLGDNTATLMTIEERLGIYSSNGTVWSQVLNSIGLEQGEFLYIEYPIYSELLKLYGVRYTPGTIMGLQTMVFFNPESALTLHLDVMNGLKSQGGWNMVTNEIVQGAGSENRREFGIFSEEDRFQFSLGYRTAAYVTDEVSWVFELGGNMLATQLKQNYVRIQNSNYQLLAAPMGNGQFTNPTSSLTSTGFGGYGAVGVELFFEEGGNLMLTARVSRDHVRLGTYEDHLWQGALYLTWVVPPQFPKFTRVSF